MHGRISRDNLVRLRPGTGHDPLRRSQTIAPAAFAFSVAAAHLMAPAWLWSLPPEGTATNPLRSIAIVVLIGLGAWYAVLAWRVAVGRSPSHVVVSPCRRAYWLSCSAGLVLCYALGLLVGNRPGGLYAFWLSAAVCHGAVWVALSGSSDRPRFVARLFERRAARVAAWTLFLSLMMPLAGEVGLRIYAFAVDDPVLARYVTDLLKLSPGGVRLGQTVNSQGYWDDEFPAERRDRTLRVAALGDETVLCGDAESNFLAQLERQIPGLEILNLGVPDASPREYAAQVNTMVASRPDVLLVCVSVATDITDAPQLPGAFDWRGLHLVQRSVDLSGRTKPCGDEGETAAAGAHPACLDDIARQLQVCRVPVRDSLQQRWRAVFRHLDELLHQCRTTEIEPMLVVLPCAFQVDDLLRQTLCRRAGYRSDQIDIDLPQRRLAAYAKDRRVQMIDLMPHLRASRKSSFRSSAAHFNKHGNSLTAVILSDWLESRYDRTLLASGR